MNPGGGDCSELRLCHCTPAWATERNSDSKRKKKIQCFSVYYFYNPLKYVFLIEALHFSNLLFFLVYFLLWNWYQVPSPYNFSFITDVHLATFFFERKFCSCCPRWRAMAQSRFTTTSTTQGQAILLPQPPE